ncbi:M50 family metallopeptidase [Asanoa sp. NPDC049573]|uniref:M50 family metallopeptidase n=1 Tax=Asanoa sp. NPDC049573 TaxID=3155396 RepID=UPI003432ACB0
MDQPSTTFVVLTFFLGLLCSVFWPATKHLITMAHEGSHAIAGSVTGGKVVSVAMRPDGSGVTTTTGEGPFLTALSGYVGPSVFGIVSATALANGMDPNVVIWVTVVLMAVIFLRVRNLFGWLFILAAGTLFVMVAVNGSPTARQVFVYTWTWFLLLGGFVHTVETNLKSVGWSGDASALRKLTKLPRGFWGGLWWLATIAALLYGGGLLIGVIDPPIGSHLR